jgi:hypothetical protein
VRTFRNSGSLRMSFCQLRLATERPKCVLKNGSSKRGARGSAIHHQLDRVDVRGIVRREEQHGFGNFFGLAPTALRNRRREELLQLGGIFCGSISAGPALPNGVFIAPGATTFTRMLRGARSAAMERAIETRPPLVAA